VNPVVRAYLSLGSNLGDRLANLVGACARLEPRGDMVVAAVSPVYETAAIGESGAVVEDQPPYLNCAVAVDTSLEPSRLRLFTAGIEEAMGRVKRGRWQPRLIDIDLVLYGDKTISTPALTVPHPRMNERAFVLKPLIDLDPGMTAPDVGPLGDLLQGVSAQGCEMHTTAADFQAAIDAQLLEPGAD
jgi:2-amino-4-hydroxy-6-hydroxymethyldihydropteridine diphosphokinase